jgi:hypothetical protein
MDPNTTVSEMRRIAARFQAGEATPEDAERLAELFEGLDNWLLDGGFPPEDWTGAPEVQR